MNKQNNSNWNIFQILHLEKSSERTAILRRMIEFVFGDKLMALNTRSSLLIFYTVSATTATAWWWCLELLDRRRINSMLEQGLYVYDKKGKIVQSEEFVKAKSTSEVVSAVRGLRIEKRVVELERYISEFKEERELMQEVIKNQKKIELKLQSIEETLKKDY